MVCYARTIPLMWMILRDARRREAESLYDHAHSWLIAIVVALFWGSEFFAPVGRVRVFRRPRGAYTLRASRYCRESLATPPYGRLHTLALPPWRATRSIRCAPRRARCAFAAHDRLSDASSATRSDRVPTLEVRMRTTSGARDPTASVLDARGEGVSVPRGGAPRRSKRLARSARLAACKPKGDDEWNARDRPPNWNAVSPPRSSATARVRVRRRATSLART